MLESKLINSSFPGNSLYTTADAPEDAEGNWVQWIKVEPVNAKLKTEIVDGEGFTNWASTGALSAEKYDNKSGSGYQGPSNFDPTKIFKFTNSGSDPI